jgi:hypothetical protein
MSPQKNSCENMVKQRSTSGSMWEWVSATTAGAAQFTVSAVKGVGGGVVSAASTVSTQGMQEATKNAISSTQEGISKAAMAVGAGKQNAKKD